MFPENLLEAGLNCFKEKKIFLLSVRSYLTAIFQGLSPDTVFAKLNLPHASHTSPQMNLSSMIKWLRPDQGRSGEPILGKMEPEARRQRPVQACLRLRCLRLPLVHRLHVRRDRVSRSRFQLCSLRWVWHLFILVSVVLASLTLTNRSTLLLGSAESWAVFVLEVLHHLAVLLHLLLRVVTRQV